ncbi:MAG TPA: hypothetical protein VFW05_01710 [Verrucomicrobiae bacterium]|nr:hypothetical protein [Verrucomicrobiae bacterium]
MRKHLLCAVLLSGTLLGTGCINSHHAARREAAVAVPPDHIVVMEAPPEPKREVVGVAPDESHVWVAGYWMRVDDRWVWVPGHWEARPRVGVAWVPGHWDRAANNRGWVWTPGHWE